MKTTDKEAMYGDLQGCNVASRPGGVPCQDPIEDSDDFAQSFDAAVWAKAFVERVKKYGPEFATDEGNMIGWFANAIMRGHDEAVHRVGKDYLALKFRMDSLEK